MVMERFGFLVEMERGVCIRRRKRSLPVSEDEDDGYTYLSHRSHEGPKPRV